MGIFGFIFTNTVDLHHIYIDGVHVKGVEASSLEGARRCAEELYPGVGDDRMHVVTHYEHLQMQGEFDS